jgi:hypothetical protein
LNLKPDPQPTVETSGLWNWDVAEAFIGSDFEHRPLQGLRSRRRANGWTWRSIGRTRRAAGARWNSGYQVKGRIDEQAHVWSA